MGLSTWKIDLPDVTPSANEFIRRYRHYAVQKKLKDYWAWLLIEAGVRRIPKATEKRFLHIVQHRLRLIDYANIWLALDKCVCDALVKLEVLVDDSPKWLDIHVEQELDIEERTVIEIAEAAWHR